MEAEVRLRQHLAEDQADEVIRILPGSSVAVRIEPASKVLVALSNGIGQPVLSLGTKLVLTEVTVAVGTGGKGGDGSGAQGGSLGGTGAAGGTPSGLAGSKAGCTGGNGGAGGDGGPAGGGRGGYSLGIAFAMPPTGAPALSSFTAGTAGDGGMEAAGAPPESHGAMGGAGECWNFATNTSCGG